MYIKMNTSIFLTLPTCPKTCYDVTNFTYRCNSGLHHPVGSGRLPLVMTASLKNGITENIPALGKHFLFQSQRKLLVNG